MNFNSYKDREKLIKRIIFWSIIIGGLLALFFSPTSSNAFAQTQKPLNVCDSLGGCLGGTNNVPDGADGIIYAIMRVVFFLIFVASAVSILFIIIGAYQMITSNGNDEQYQNGLKTFRNACIGLILAIISITIVALIGAVIPGISIF